MKKSLAFLLALAMTTSVSTSTIYTSAKQVGLGDSSNSQMQGLVKNKGNIGSNNFSNGHKFMYGKLSNTKVNNINDVVKYLKDNMANFKLSHGDFNLISQNKDELGYNHYKFQYAVDGLKVTGNEIVVHVNKDGIIYSVNGQLESTVPQKQYKKNVKLAVNDAVKNAENKIGSIFTQSSSELCLLNVNTDWTPVYQLKLWNEEDVNTWMATVDAITGKVIDTHEDKQSTATTATGIGLKGDTKTLYVDYRSGKYYMDNLSNVGRITTYDARNGYTLPGTIVSSTTKTFNTTAQRAAVDASAYVDKAYKYFKTNFGREGFDGRGSAFTVTVHYGRNYLNAYYNSRYGFVFGDGDNTYAKDFAKGLDIVAHECTHAVTQYSANLNYENQSGALNESFSDVFGTLIENQDGDWIIGEDVVLPTSPVPLLRSMQDPTLYGQPANMSQYQYLPNTQDGDWGGVHANSGIPNKAFYNVCVAIGKDKAAKIYYRALTSYLTTTSNFQDARDALEASALDLYGTTEQLAVANAFYNVGVGTQP